MSSARRFALILALAAPAVLAPLAGDAADSRVPDTCQVPAWMLDDIAEFSHSRTSLAANRRLTVAAIGASSTQGTGASSASASWPARLEALLKERLPGVTVSVANLGKRSLTARLAVERFAGEVAALDPDLVIWDAGTVEAARSENPGEFGEFVTQGADLVAAMDADLILMDPQYARDTARVINFQPYLEILQHAAAMPGVNLFPRHEIMQHWATWDRVQPRTREEMIKGNDQIYDCIAQLLAGVIDRGLRQPAHAQRR